MAADDITRVEIAEAVRGAFNGAGAGRADLIAAAAAAGARSEVLDVLGGLPEMRFREVRDLWSRLQHLPIGV